MREVFAAISMSSCQWNGMASKLFIVSYSVDVCILEQLD